MTGALGSGSTTRPPLSQPWARALPFLLGSGPSPFEATRQPSKGPPKAADRRPNPLAGIDLAARLVVAALVCSQRLRHNTQLWLPMLGDAEPLTLCVTGGLVR